MKTLAPALIIAALTSSSAWAQLPPLIVSSQPYMPLTAGTRVTGLNGDDQGVLVPLGFTFPYLGQTYTHVMLTTNGVIVPGNVGTTVCNFGCLSNYTFPSTSTSTTNPVLAAWWDDLNLSSGGEVRTLSSPGQFTVEYSNVPRYSSSGSFVTVQIKLSASGAVFFHYDSLTTGTGTAWTASAGFGNHLGTLGANLLTGCTTSCNATARSLRSSLARLYTSSSGSDTRGT